MYYFVVTQLKNRSLVGAILFVRKGQTQEQNLTNKQKSVQKLCIRFFVVKSITVFNESKWVKFERRLAWYLYAFLKSYFCRCSSSFQVFVKTRLGPFQCSCPQRYRVSLRKRPNSKTLWDVSVFVPTPTQFIRTSTSKLGGEGVASDKVFGKCELTHRWDQGCH